MTVVHSWSCAFAIESPVLTLEGLEGSVGGVVVICCGTTEKPSSSVPTLAGLTDDSEGIVVLVVCCGTTEKPSSSVARLAALEASPDFESDGVMMLKGSTEVDLGGMMVVCCGTMEKPGLFVPTLAVPGSLTEVGCDVVVVVVTTDVNSEDVVGKRVSLPPSFDFSKARRILELCFFAFLSSLDTLAILRESKLLSSVGEIRLLAARRALLSMLSIENVDAIKMLKAG